MRHPERRERRAHRRVDDGARVAIERVGAGRERALGAGARERVEKARPAAPTTNAARAFGNNDASVNVGATGAHAASKAAASGSSGAAACPVAMPAVVRAKAMNATASRPSNSIGKTGLA